MNPKELIEEDLKKGKTQTEIANKIGVSNATVYKILYTHTKQTVATLTKIAKAYGKPIASFIAEETLQYGAAQSGETLTEKERRLVAAFRCLDERRQDRALDNLEDMVLALRESGERDGPEKDLKESSYKQSSNG